MKFTERAKRSVRLAALLVLSLSLGACQFVQNEPEEAPAADQPPPNPYMKNRPDVDEADIRRFDAARAAMLAGDYQRAETALREIVETSPQLSGPWLNLALLMQQTDRLDQADAFFEAAIDANPSNLTAYNQYAIHLRQQGRFDAAEQQYLRALEVWPLHDQSHLNLGILYELYRGELEKALQHYRAYQSLQAEPERRVAGWIIDLERRVPETPAETDDAMSEEES